MRFDEFFALDDVSFDIMPGDFYGLIGLNGSGKSTLLKVISGVYKPSAGKVTVNGTIAPLIELGAGFDMDLTARENIYLNGTVLGYTPKYIDSKFDDIVEFSELQDFLDVPLKNYSSGMVARLAFAVATITKPDILIADEILSVGDFLFQEKCEKRMAELLSGGTTVILVSHSIDQIERMCNKVAWLDHGHLRRIGATKEITAEYRRFEKKDAMPDEPDTAEILKHALADGKRLLLPRVRSKTEMDWVEIPALRLLRDTPRRWPLSPAWPPAATGSGWGAAAGIMTDFWHTIRERGCCSAPRPCCWTSCPATTGTHALRPRIF